MNIKKTVDIKNTRELAVGIFYYVSSSIFGPLVFFGGLGYLADKLFDTRPTLLVVGVFLAFVVTNVMLFKKIKSLNKTVASYGPQSEDKKQVEDK